MDYVYMSMFEDEDDEDMSFPCYVWDFGWGAFETACVMSHYEIMDDMPPIDLPYEVVIVAFEGE